MNIRKKALTLVISFLLCTASILPNFAAAETTADSSVVTVTGISLTDKAEALNNLSILSRSNTGFNLENPLTRAQAALFIVTLLGEKSFVIDNRDIYRNTKFTDVKPTEWYAPFVGYCTSIKYLSGNTDGTFKPNDTISEKTFLSLLLKVLGYTSGTDFTKDDIYQFAYGLKLVTAAEYAEQKSDDTKYTRGKSVDAIYNALTLQIKDTGITLIKKLVTEGAVTRDSAMSTGLIVDEIKSAIEKIATINDNKISVKFNEPLTTINPSDIAVFESEFGRPKSPVAVTIESRTDDEMVIKIFKQKPKAYYSVEITNVTDTEGNSTAKISGEFRGYSLIETNSDYFMIHKVEPISKNVINTYFTHPIAANAETSSFYEIYQGENLVLKGSSDTLTVKKMQSYNNAVTLYFKTVNFVEDAVYTIKINGNLVSSYGSKLNEGLGNSGSFIGKTSENIALGIKKISCIGEKTLQVEFTKEVDSFYAKQIVNYLVLSDEGQSIAVSKAILTGEGTSKGSVVHLGLLNSLEKGKNYNLKIKFMTDNIKQSKLKEESLIPFTCILPDKTDLTIKSVTVCDKQTVLVKFTSNLDYNTATNITNYLVTGLSDTGYTAIPSKVYFNPSIDPRTVKLFFPTDALLKDSKSSYSLKVFKGLKDELGNDQSKDLQPLAFSGPKPEAVKPVLEEAVIISANTIKLKFSKEVAAEAPNILSSNYWLEYTANDEAATKAPIITGYLDANTIVLIFDSLDAAMPYTLRINSIIDYSGTNIKTLGLEQTNITVKAGK